MEEKKKKSNPSIYGEREPKSVNGLNKKYMGDFLTDKLKKGEITKDQIKKFKEKKAGKKDSDVHKLFAEMFLPSLIKPEPIEFDDVLDALIADD